MNIPMKILRSVVKLALASLSAEQTSQRDSGETRFFNTTRATTEISWQEFWCSHVPRALVRTPQHHSPAFAFPRASPDGSGAF